MTADNDDLAKELDPILDSYDEPHTDKINEEQARDFLAKFERTKVQTIRPTMERIGKYLEKKGHSYKTKEQASIHTDNPSITMEIYPRAKHPPQEHEYPVISFIAEADVQKVGIVVWDGMPGRPALVRGHSEELESLTEEYVRNQIVTVLRISFKTPGRPIR